MIAQTNPFCQTYLVLKGFHCSFIVESTYHLVMVRWLRSQRCSQYKFLRKFWKYDTILESHIQKFSNPALGCQSLEEGQRTNQNMRYLTFHSNTRWTLYYHYILCLKKSAMLQIVLLKIFWWSCKCAFVSNYA